MVGQRRLVDFPGSAAAMRELAASGAEMIVLFSDFETTSRPWPPTTPGRVSSSWTA